MQPELEGVAADLARARQRLRRPSSPSWRAMSRHRGPWPLLAAFVVAVVVLVRMVRGPAAVSLAAPATPDPGSRERELTALVEQDFLRHLSGLDVPTVVSPARRLMSLQQAAHVLLHGVPGDFVETGVFRGGMSILLLKLLEHLDRPEPSPLEELSPLKELSPLGGAAASQDKRRYWAADSFEGLPAQVEADNPADGPDWKGGFAAGLDEFSNNLKEHGVGDTGRLQVLKGWFNDTLPGAREKIKQISYLRLDGDLYVSTHDALINLYDLVSPCGIVYIDDYTSFPGCKKAVDEYRLEKGIQAPLHLQAVPEPSGRPGEAAWWMVPCAAAAAAA